MDINIDLENVPHILQFGKKKYIVGLEWDAVDSEKKIIEEVRSVVDNLEGDDKSELYVSIEGAAPQFSVLKKTKSINTGVVSAASVINQVFSEDIIIIYSSIDGYWLSAYNSNNFILKDIFLNNKQDADKILSELIEDAEWDRVIADNDFSVPESIKHETDIDISDHLSNFSGSRTKDIYPLKAQLKTILIFGVVGGLILGGFYSASELNEINELSKKTNSEFNEFIEPKFVEILPPWYSKPKSSYQLQLCEDNFDRLPVLIPGWTSQSVTCLPDKKKTIYTWVENGGTFDWAKHWLAAYDTEPKYGKKGIFAEIKMGSTPDQG